MMVAVSLLSLLSVGMLIAMRLGFNTMDKVNSHLVMDRRVVNSRGIIENEISGFMFTMADFMPGSPGFRSVPFIEADPQSMRFVTSYSLNDGWRGRPQIAVLQVIPGDVVAGDPRRGVRLIVNELPYTGPVQAGETITGIEADPASGQSVPQFAPVATGPAIVRSRGPACVLPLPVSGSRCPKLRSSSGGLIGSCRCAFRLRYGSRWRRSTRARRACM